MPPSSPTRRRRSSPAASILQPLQTNTITPVPSPQRSPKRSSYNRRKSESDENSPRHQRKGSFATPSNTHRISNPAENPSASFDVCIQTISFTNGSPCVALLERDAAASVPSIHSNPKPSSNPYQVSLCYSDTDRRSAGYGMFAIRKIPRGGTILVERPVMVVSSASLIGCNNVQQLLDSKARKALLRLTDAHAKSAESTLDGIVRTNGLEIEIGTKKCIALFLDMSRVNHSCGPNAMWRWDPLSFSITLEAVRPISEGSEITIPYIDCFQSRVERRKQLKALYNFDCYCQHCDIHWSESNASLQSDMNRKELLECGDRVPSFESWCSNKSYPDDALVKLHLWALETRAKEGLELFGYKKHIDAIAMCYGALEDVENFTRWIERARNANMDERTESELAVLDRWIEDPRRFPVWGWRGHALAH